MGTAYRSAEMLPEDMTTVQAVAHWYKWARAGGLADHTANQYRSMILDLFASRGREFWEINPQDLVDWAEELNQRGPTVSTCGHKAATNFWRWLRFNNLDDRAITELMPHSEPRTKMPVAFNPSELSAIWGACKPRELGFFKMLYYSGARRSEALNLSRTDLSVQGVTLRHTKRSSAGGGSERFIPFSPAAGAELTELLNPARDRVFFDRVFDFERSIVSSWCSKLSKELGFRVHPHKFRATFATTLLTRGVDIRTVQDLMGHADVKTTMRYLAVTDERKTSAVMVL